MALHAEIFCRINSYKKDMKFLTFCKSLVYIAWISPVKTLIFEASEPHTAPDQRRLFGLYAYNIIYVHKLYNIHIKYLYFYIYTYMYICLWFSLLIANHTFAEFRILPCLSKAIFNYSHFSALYTCPPYRWAFGADVLCLPFLFGSHLCKLWADV